jgi:hypothetical protein
MRLDAGAGRQPWSAIGFDLAAHKPQPGDMVDLVFQVQRDRYGVPQMRIVDLGT